MLAEEHSLENFLLLLGVRFPHGQFEVVDDVLRVIVDVEDLLNEREIDKN